ncbi:Uncharacterised protein [Mycolicibacterium smegmatis]|nr:Uncharacterised protein [Mycolicibacterium smegmatis]
MSTEDRATLASDQRAGRDFDRLSQVVDAKRSSLSNFKVGKRVISGDKIVR